MIKACVQCEEGNICEFLGLLTEGLMCRFHKQNMSIVFLAQINVFFMLFTLKKPCVIPFSL